MDYRRGTVWVPQALINTYVAQRLTVVSHILVNASKVISLEYIWTTLPRFYLRHIVFCEKGHSLHCPYLFSKVKRVAMVFPFCLYLELCTALIQNCHKTYVSPLKPIVPCQEHNTVEPEWMSCDIEQNRQKFYYVYSQRTSHRVSFVNIEVRKVRHCCLSLDQSQIWFVTMCEQS